MAWLYIAPIADETPCFHNAVMSHLLIFGPGYSARRIARLAGMRGWHVSTVSRSTIDDGIAVHGELAAATHILSSVPPQDDADPVLARYGDAIARSKAEWIGYLSSTGVYGDSRGAWIDERAPIAGRRPGRNAADLAWQTVHAKARVFRLPGIYGPGRSGLDRLKQGRGHRINLPEQVFSRIHVDDLVAGVAASFDHGPPGVYNLADDEPAPQNDVILYAAELLGMSSPPLLPLESAALTPEARAFYGENRRVANHKAKRLLGWRCRYPDYRSGLRACLDSPLNADDKAAMSASD